MLFLLIYFGLYWAVFAVHGLSLVVVRRAYSLLLCVGLLLLQSMGSRACRPSSYGAGA